jgi:branched-chain amino acid aminotransferase
VAERDAPRQPLIDKYQKTEVKMEKTYGFSYTKAHVNYVSYHNDGKWDDGALVSDDMVTISKMSTALHYGQEAFEGMKAYRRINGDVQIFRPYENAKRFRTTCEKIMMPPVDPDVFVEAVKRTVRANIDLVPPHDSKATLYIRPYMIGIGHNIGLKPADTYLFGIVVLPVGTYFGPAAKPVDVIVSDVDRAAPNGTGHVKVGGNYAASLRVQVEAKRQGYADALFLDPKTHTMVEEVGAANFFAITKDGAYLTPESPSILKSITNMSLMTLAEDKLGIPVRRDPIMIDSLGHIEEAGACGTAAIITPIGSITHKGSKHVFPAHQTIGKTTKALYDLLTGIQFGDVEDPYGWTVRV